MRTAQLCWPRQTPWEDMRKAFGTLHVRRVLEHNALLCPRQRRMLSHAWWCLGTPFLVPGVCFPTRGTRVLLT